MTNLAEGGESRHLNLQRMAAPKNAFSAKFFRQDSLRALAGAERRGNSLADFARLSAIFFLFFFLAFVYFYIRLYKNKYVVIAKLY